MKQFIHRSTILFTLLSLSGISAAKEQPNVILMMCDDLGWGDTGFNGNTIIQTPHLDQIAEEGMKLNHFYSVGPVCSPTRASFLTGRHYYRMGIWTANAGHLPKEEYTIAKMLKKEGYATGHFGKWHLGTLSPTMSSKGLKRKPKINFAPPWERDYDKSFVTESATSTWNPGYGKCAVNNPYFENGVVATENLKGCDSRVMMDRAIPFIQEAVKNEKPFLAVIWFHAPHEDIQAGPEYLKMYEGHGEAAHYYGCITAVDDQIGRLRSELKNLGIEKNTAIFFCSDNGPEGKHEMQEDKPIRRAGKTAGFRGRKRSVYEGGVRVPALALWPEKIKPGSVCDMPCSVLDYLPTVQEITNSQLHQNRIIDGQSILPILKGKSSIHPKEIPFRYKNHATLVHRNYKLVITSSAQNELDELYDLKSDPKETTNIIKDHPELAQKMRAKIIKFLISAKQSHLGAEYQLDDYKPVDSWHAF